MQKNKLEMQHKNFLTKAVPKQRIIGKYSCGHIQKAVGQTYGCGPNLTAVGKA